MGLVIKDKKIIGRIEPAKEPFKIGREEKDPPSFTDISLLKLSELSKRNMAIEIYSEILGCNIWLCSNEEMVEDVKRDNPSAITYTVEEIRHLIRLRPTPEDIRRIHETKSVFSDSRIVDTELKDEN